MCIRQEWLSHKINGIKYLNARLLLLAMLTLTPPAALAEDPAHCCRRSISGGAYQRATTGHSSLYCAATVVCSRELKDLRRWRLRLPNTAPLTHYGEDFFALDALAGLSYKFDESQSSADGSSAPKPI